MSRKFCVVAAVAGAVALLCAPLSASAHTTSGHMHLVGSGAGGIRARIIGGSGAVQSDWPFMAFVAHYDPAGNPDFVCSGTVVSPNVVLTAGHCAVDETTGAPLDPSGFRVVTGSVDVTNTSLRQVSPVSQVVVNPGYAPATADSPDASLLVLSTATTAAAIPLATTSDQYLEAPGTGVVIAGWGDTYDGGPPQTYLRWADTVLQRPGYCSGFDPFFDASSELCTVNPPDFLTGTCNGDSGGPLAALGPTGALVEIGIITRGPSDCDTNTADYFTATMPLVSWVAAWIKTVAPAPPPPPSPPAQPTPPSPPPSQPASRAPLPTLTLALARQYVRQTVGGALGTRARPTHSYTATCSRVSSTRFTCAVRFWHGPNDYYGTVTVYLVSGPNGLLEWTDRYTLHWVSDQCYFHSGHRRTCSIQTRRGSW